jgi:hypothetical protein
VLCLRAPDTALSNAVASFLRVVEGVEPCGFRLIEFLDRIAVRLLLFILLSYHVAHILGKVVEPSSPPLQTRESSFHGE